MSDVYARTIRTGGFDIVTVTPFEDLRIAIPEDINLLPLIKDPEKFTYNDPPYTDKSVPFDIFQVCIKLNGQLYVWKEHEISE